MKQTVFFISIRMKLILLSILFLSLSSCGKRDFTQLFSKEANLLSNESDAADISVYLEERGEFKSIPDLNQEAKVLSFLDKVVFLNPDDFLENKNSLQTADFLKKEDIEKNEQEIQLSSQSFCSESLKELQEEGEKSRYFTQFISSSAPSYINIISLIPKKLLSKKMRQNIYCSFIFEFKDKKTYFLTHQEINTSVPKKDSHKISLLNIEKEFHSVQTGDILKKEDLESIIIDSEDQEQVSQYELFCDGLFLFSIPISSSNKQRYAFKNLFKNRSIDTSSKKIQDCVFYAAHNENVRAISPHFQIDFSSLPLVKEKTDLSEIGEPSVKKQAFLFANIKFPHFDKIKNKKDYSSIEVVVDSKCVDSNYSRELFTKSTRLPLSEEAPMMAFFPEEFFFFLSLNKSSFILRKALTKKEYSREFERIKERNEIHPIVEDFLEDRRVKEKIRELSDDIYKLELNKEKSEDINEVNEDERIKERNEIHPIVEDFLEDRGVKKKIRELNNDIHKLELNRERSKDINKIYEDIVKFECIYTVKLEDKTKPDNQKVFEDRLYNIKLNGRKRNLFGYKMDYINNVGLMRSFIFKLLDLNHWAKKLLNSPDADTLNFKYRIYKDHLFHLDNIEDYDPGGFRIDSLEEVSVDKAALKCHTEKLAKGIMNHSREDFNFVKSNWNADFINKNSLIPLKTFLNDKKFKEELNKTKDDSEDDYLSVCRLFLYSSYNQEFFLKYFSPEIRFLY